MMPSYGPPFSGKPLRDELALAEQMAVDLLMSWPASVLLNTAEADLAGQLVRLSSFNTPVILRNEAFLEPPSVIRRLEERDGRRVQAACVRFTLVVPIDGQASLLVRTPSREIPGSPDCEVNGQALKLHCDGEPDPAKARAHFEQQLKRVEEQAAVLIAEIDAHNERMARQLPDVLARRKAKLLKMEESIGYPIQRRPDADSYSIPLTRKRLTPQSAAATASASPYAPEPALIDADYEAALAVLRNARNALERSPSMSAKLDEEEIRDLLLIC